MSPKGLKQLAHDEGIKLFVYWDTKDLPTIGVGFNLAEKTNEAVFLSVTGWPVAQALRGKPITEQEAYSLLAVTVARAEDDAEKLVPNLRKLTDDQRDAIVNWVFNVGLTTAKQFKNTLAAINRGDGRAAAAGLLNSKYAKDVGQRANRVAAAIATLGQPSQEPLQGPSEASKKRSW